MTSAARSPTGQWLRPREEGTAWLSSPQLSTAVRSSFVPSQGAGQGFTEFAFLAPSQVARVTNFETEKAPGSHWSLGPALVTPGTWGPTGPPCSGRSPAWVTLASLVVRGSGGQLPGSER